MNVDAKLPLDDAQATRDHRVRTNASADRGSEASQGAPTERTTAGGPVASSRSRNGRDGAAQDDATRASKDDARAEERRLSAERELARMLRLPADTRLDIDVDAENEEVRVFVRERDTGKILREVPPDEAQPLLERLEQARGTPGSLVDRSF